MSILFAHKTNNRWDTLKIRLLLFYLLASLLLLILSLVGQLRLLNEVGHTFGGFLWEPGAEKQVVVIATFTDQSAFAGEPLLPGSGAIIASVNGQPSSVMSDVYRRARPGQLITYTLAGHDRSHAVTYPAEVFTPALWWQIYGLALAAGLCWLLVGGWLLGTARTWNGAVEGLTLLPVAALFLLVSRLGNVQTAYPLDAAFQLLWFPALALLGAALVHLSLVYGPGTMGVERGPGVRLDACPYLPLLALEAFHLGVFFLHGSIPTSWEIALDGGYGLLGCLVALVIGVVSLVRPFSAPGMSGRQAGDVLLLWIGSAGLLVILCVLPPLFTGRPFLTLPVFSVLGALYPLVLLFVVRARRQLTCLQEDRGGVQTTLRRQQRTIEDLQRANADLQRATSLLLHADARLRSQLSARLHDQPRQQALRIRSLLGHWQHKLKVELERDPALQSFGQPIIEVLGKVRKISEALEDDLDSLQLLVEDAYQRGNLGLKLHLEKLVREDLPALYPASPLKIQADFWALDTLSQELEQTPAGEKFAEAVSYTVTQALLNVYKHAGASYASVRTVRTDGYLEVSIVDDGHGFDIAAVPPEKSGLFKAELKAREAGGTLLIHSTPRSLPRSGTMITLKLPFPSDTPQVEVVS